MHTARIPPVHPAPAIITAVLAMHAGHICPSSELLIRPHLSGTRRFRSTPQFAHASAHRGPRWRCSWPASSSRVLTISI